MAKILVSACLLGEPVRYDAQNLVVEDAILQGWLEQHRVISFCPEVASGLAVPRTAAEIHGGDGHQVLAGRASVIDKTGQDVTTFFVRGAQQALAICIQHKIKMAVLAQRSPSCADRQIYNGEFNRTLINGSGVSAALLQQNGIRVFNQTALIEASAYLDQLLSEEQLQVVFNREN